MKDKLTLVGDFETTVFDGQIYTEVWASAVVEIGTEDVKILHSIDETFEYLKSFKRDLIIYYHNLKFDGEFWLSFLLNKLQFKQAFTQIGETQFELKADDKRKMKNNTFQYAISDMGQWYCMYIKVGGHLIEIRDSLKLLPFSVKQLGKSFATKHKKLDMEYKGFRYAGCTITDEEKKYIANDVLVVKEALEIMFEQGHKRLTIGSCCLEEFKATHDKEEYKGMFPDLSEYIIDDSVYGYKNADLYIRKSYKGGWCYVVKGKENKLLKNGTTADVNSLYPSMMSSESGNIYPYGLPTFWKGNFIPPEALYPNRYYFVRVKTRFKIKPNHLPFIQIKDSFLYHSTECLETSDYYSRSAKRYVDYTVKDGVKEKLIPVLTLTMTDYKLLQDHYNLFDFEILDGCYFNAMKGMFDTYIEKYKKIKMESKGAIRTLAKLFLNNLYGKMASSTDSSFKYAYLRDDKSIGYAVVPEQDKKSGYIAVGSAITSYARNFTIRAAQSNFYGANKQGFIYADTDSIHCDLPPEKIKGIKVDEVKFCCWKLEACWDIAYFVRQKTYIEHITHEDLKPVEEPYYSVKCAGMPERCKDLFIKSITNYEIKDDDNFTEEELEFLKTKRTIKDFTYGLTVPSKLLPVRILGGVILVDTYYQLREHIWT